MKNKKNKIILLKSNEETPFSEGKKLYKIYNDGGHYVASCVFAKKCKKTKKRVSKNNLDLVFDTLYVLGVKNNLSGKDLFLFIKNEMVETYMLTEKVEELDRYIKTKIKIKNNNFYKRVKRFKRKANLNKWNYFVTITYDDKKHSPDSFRKSLRKCLSNLHTRHNWRYMGVFELAPNTNRLHFHCLMYIPNCEMVGEIEEVKDYSIAQHKMQVTNSNTFFSRQFGRNDFIKINQTEMTINYILKYLQKTNEKILYSRGIASEILKTLKNSEIASTYLDYIYKYVLFDDVISWEDDIMHFKFKYKQVCMFDCG